MSSIEIDKKEQSVIDNSGTAQISIPKDWRALIGLQKNGEMTDTCTVALMKGKHGYYLAVYNSTNQQK